jgi:hypothetical protein
MDVLYRTGLEKQAPDKAGAGQSNQNEVALHFGLGGA